MRAVMVMFDTLTRNYLSTYGNKWVATPNFERLKEKCCQFNRFYGGSMPCMPARRELHTGRYNFLHRSWGPLEPFDFSVFEYLKENGIYTHLCTDHSHYFEDGGATYHNRYTTWEGFRGQEGDRWVPQDYAKIPDNRSELAKKGVSVQQHYANILRMDKEKKMSSVQTFQAGLDFIENHHHKDNWFVQIESFDPHEPFYVPQKYRELYDLTDEINFNWPIYGPVDEEKSQKDITKLRKEYAALITMCDTYLGKVLDMMDKYDMWKDTMLIVNTDHGFLLGEHGFFGKNFPPMYDEVIHTPFYIYVPGIRRKEYEYLAQTIDISATILDYFNLSIPEYVQGKSLIKAMQEDISIHESILYGIHGGHVNITDEEYTLMKSNINDDNQPFVECTLMPTNMRGFFTSDVLKTALLMEGDSFSRGIPYLKYTSKTYLNSKIFGDILLDSEGNEIDISTHIDLYESYKRKLANKMKEVDCPSEEFLRLGLKCFK